MHSTSIHQSQLHMNHYEDIIHIDLQANSLIVVEKHFQQDLFYKQILRALSFQRFNNKICIARRKLLQRQRISHLLIAVW